jgi:hypothetical protein
MSADLPPDQLERLRGSGTVFIAEDFDAVYEDEPIEDLAEVELPSPLPEGNWIPFTASAGERFPIDYVPADPRYLGHWEGIVEGRGAFFEQGPGWNDLEEAAAWGRERTGRVLVRLGIGDPIHYSAGTEGFDDPDVRPWPPPKPSS